jgi:hypothetical protein
VTIAARVFASSMTFGFVVAAIYLFTTHELVGTMLLVLFGIGFAFVTLYLFSVRGRTRLDGDEQRTPRELAGERIGVFSAESPWPVLLAVCSTALLIGVVLHPMLAIFGAAGFVATLWQLVRESV